MPPILEVRDVRRRYGSARGLEGASLTVAAGEIYGLIGPNGAGKTSLVRAVSGRLRLDGGTVTIAGQDPGRGPARRALGLVPQEVALYPDLTVAENLRFLAELAGLDAAAARAAVPSALAWIDLADRRDTLAGRLSGGQRRRVNVAAGTLHNPALLLLDEPTVGIDLPARERIHRMLDELRSRGMAMLLATHDLDEAATVADRVGIIVDGAIRAEGTPAALVAEHYAAGDRDVAITLNAAPPPDGVAVLRAARLVSGDDPLVWSGALAGVERLPALLEALAAAGVLIQDTRVREPGLAGVFLRVTGRELSR